MQIIIAQLLVIHVTNVCAQPNTLWEKTFGGSDHDYGRFVKQTKNLGFIVVGSTYSYGSGNSDVWLFKIDSSGNEEWNQTFGGDERDMGNSVCETSDGGYIITGSTESFGAGKSDVWLIKTDARGHEVWNKTFGGNGRDYGACVRQTENCGYIISGSTASFGSGESDIWLIKIDSSGHEVWNHTFGGNGWDGSECIHQTTADGYIISGSTASFGAGNNDIWLIKTDSNGNKLWDYTFGGSNNDGSHSLQQTADGGYIITGWTHSFGEGNADLWLIKTDSNGKKVWSKTIGGSKHDDGSSIQQTTGGGYIITGWTESFGRGRLDLWLVKTDANGKKIWSQTFGDKEYDMGYSVQQIIGGGYIITGHTNSHNGGSNDDLWLIRIAPEVTKVESNTDDLTFRFMLEQNYPNPFNPSTEIAFQIPISSDVKLEVYNVQGQKVTILLDEKRDAGSYKVHFDANGIPAGLYFCRLKAEKLAQVKKMLLVK